MSRLDWVCGYCHRVVQPEQMVCAFCVKSLVNEATNALRRAAERQEH